MDDFELEIKKEFLGEAIMNLEEVEGSFMELESASDPKPLLDKIFRLAHNLKGGSRAVGFSDVAEFTHELENLVLKIQKGEIPLSSEIITTLLQSNDRLVEMMSELKGNLAATFDNSDLILELQAWISGSRVAAESKDSSTVPAEAEQLITGEDENFEVKSEFEGESSQEIPNANNFFAKETTDVSENSTPGMSSEGGEALSVSQAQARRVKTRASDTAGKEDEIIRVSLSKIDLLNDYVGELIVLQSIAQQQGSTSLVAKLDASLRQMMKLSKDIQSLSMSLRMLPVKPLVQKLQRVVRDTAKVLNKDVSFQVFGEQMDIDKSVLDRLSDPLIHILRNAVDHGLETLEGRIDSNKPKQGNIELSFFNEGNHLIVEVKDDGKGINSEVVRKKAIERGIISEGQSLSEKQLVHLVFHPGFSTKAETSEISGRGVGMDVVKTNIENIGGQVDVVTKVGNGSTFRLQIPLTLSVVEGIVVATENNRYVIPLSQVQEMVNLKSQRIFPDKLGMGSCFELRGTVVPMLHLDAALSNKKEKVVHGEAALIVNVEEQPIALVVSEVIRAQQIVIKPLTNGIVPQRGWVGTCVLGDGLPTLILNPVDLLSGKITQSVKNEINIQEAA